MRFDGGLAAEVKSAPGCGHGRSGLAALEVDSSGKKRDPVTKGGAEDRSRRHPFGDSAPDAGVRRPALPRKGRANDRIERKTRHVAHAPLDVAAGPRPLPVSIESELGKFRARRQAVSAKACEQEGARLAIDGQAGFAKR